MEVWSERRAVPVDDGLFAVYLGTMTELDLTLFQQYPDLSLTLEIDGDEELAPIPLAFSPYAAYAALSGDATTLQGQAPEDIGVLSQLDCATDQIIRYDGSAWVCANALDSSAFASLLTSENVVRSGDLATVATTGNFSDLNGVPMSVLDGDDDTLAALSCPAGNVAKNMGGVWGCAADADTLAALNCTNGQIAKRSGANWICAPDDSGANYAAIAPIQIAGTSISLIAGGISNTYLAAGAVTNASIAAGANIAPDKINGTAATLSGNQNFDTGTLYIDAASNEVGIGTTSPNAELDVNGDVNATRYTLPVQTGYASVSALDFRIFDPDEDDIIDASSSGYMWSKSAPDSAFSVLMSAPIQLPHGVTITEFSCRFYDNDATNNLSGSFSLSSRLATSTGRTTHASVTFSSATTGTPIQTTTDTTISSSTVDNQNREYFIYTSWGVPSAAIGSSNLRIYGCAVTYTYTQLGR